MEKTIVKGMLLLESLALSEESRGISELSRELKWTKSSVHRFLETFTTLGYVRRDENSRYALNYKLWQLGAKSIQNLDIRAVVLPYLHELRRETGETARLSILAGDHALCIEQVESQHPVRVQTQIGGVLSLSSSATGKAILAFQDEALIDRVAANLRQYTSKTVTSKVGLLKELAAVRKNGYALNRGEVYLSICGVAAPVWNHSGEVAAAIGLSGPTERLPPQTLTECGRKVARVAARISRDMGFHEAQKVEREPAD